MTKSTAISKYNYLSVKVSVINQVMAEETLKADVGRAASYVCFPDSYTILSAAKDAKLNKILSEAWLTMPDGKPLEIYARRKGFQEVRTVSGFWTCKALLEDPKHTHYFYGSSPKVLAHLQENLEAEFPNASVLGYKSPPFVPLETIESDKSIEADMAEIAKLKPDYLWIGISSPKQDYLMARYYQSFDKSILLGVGGVFEYLSGDVSKSPEWMKKMGLRWMYRLLKEPRRLGPKYLLLAKGIFKLIRGV